MIRPTDFVTTSAWVRPASAPAASDGADSTNWFDAEAPQGGERIRGDVPPHIRGLTAQQHADRVLQQLYDDSNSTA